VRGQIDLGQRAGDRLGQLGALEAHGPPEVRDVLADRQVGVDARALGDVADLLAQRRVACRVTEHGHRAALDDLHADDGPHERRLA
jgi:hypothetical protein